MPLWRASKLKQTSHLAAPRQVASRPASIADGHWCGELEGDTILESEYILLLASRPGQGRSRPQSGPLHLSRSSFPAAAGRCIPAARRDQRQREGLLRPKLTGHDPGSATTCGGPAARSWPRGGADAVNSFTRFYLALLGQISYDHCPAVPPELLLLPNWSPINLYRDERLVADDRRAAVDHVGASAGHAARPRELGIRELFLKHPPIGRRCAARAQCEEPGWFTWDRFFRRLDRASSWPDRRWRPLRTPALAAAERWMTRPLRRQRRPGSDLPADDLEHHRPQVPGL